MTESVAMKKDYLSATEVVAQAIGSVAPSVTPAVLVGSVFAITGNGTWIVFVFAALTLLLWTTQLNAFTRQIATSGGFTVLIAQSLGSTASVVAGWAQTIAYVFSVSFCTAGFTSIFHAFMPSILLSLGGGVTALLLALSLAYRDIKLSARVTLTLELATMSGIVGLIFYHFFHTGHFLDQAQLHLDGIGLDDLRKGLAVGFLSFAGFESVCTLGVETKNSKKALPRAALRSVLICGLFFVISSYGLVDAFQGSTPALDKIDSPITKLAQLSGLSWLGGLMALGVLSSFFACMLGYINATGRVFHGLAHCGLFHAKAQKIHRTYSTPHIGVTFAALLAVIPPILLTSLDIPLGTQMDILGTLSALGILTCYLLVAIGAPLYRKKKNNLKIHHVIVSLITITLLSIPILGLLYPVPEGPEAFLPYIFLALFVPGLGWFLSMRRRNPQKLKALENAFLKS